VFYVDPYPLWPYIRASHDVLRAIWGVCDDPPFVRCSNALHHCNIASDHAYML
jgi:hypothetical protein